MQHISRKGLDKVRIVPVNSVLLSCTGTIGKVAINKIALTTNQQINSIVCKNILKPEYLGYFFENKTNSLSVLTDNVGVKHVNTQMLRDFLVPLPPIEIQEKIIGEITEIEKKESEAKQKINKLQDRINKIFEYQKNTVSAKEIAIKDIAKSLFAGGDIPRDNFSKSKTDEFQIPIYSNNVTKAIYGYTNIVKVNEPCVTITARGTIGHVEFRNEKFYPIIRLIVLIPKIEVANPLYLKYILSRIGIKNTGSVIPQLTIPKISDVKVQLPLLKIQEKIVKEVEEIEQKIERAKQFLINAKEMKQEVLNKHLK